MATSRTQNIDLGIVRLEYGESERLQRAVLTIETDKHDCGIVSDATVFWHGRSSRQHLFGLGSSGGDFSKRLRVRATRGTQRNIDAQHAEAFTAETIETLKQAARAHYARVIETGEDGHGNTSYALTDPATVAA